ncbi:terminase small subunit [Streptococcus azizii]|uniref:Terminase n=1 Tax=Streptococcus azizii TaxID=1579424 RepID=A0AB36JM73_9STRE|nr:terminase small subunit [Streptococcus azizii]ONK25733.1 terminase [Streptococcus azizii]
MNERQRRFADEYIKTGNIEQSALKAGYSENYARSQSHKLLANVGIKSYIDEQMAGLHEKNIMDATEALYILSEIARGKRDEEVLMLNLTTGKVERHTKKADNATVIKAITEILKRYPTAKQSEKLELEIEKLKSQLIDTQIEDETITIADKWEVENESS